MNWSSTCGELVEITENDEGYDFKEGGLQFRLIEP